jgi:hypothetical protein
MGKDIEIEEDATVNCDVNELLGTRFLWIENRED